MLFTHVVRDDLPLQRVPLHQRGVVLGERRGEIALQRGRDPGIVRQVRRDELVLEPDLRVGEQHRALGPGEADAALSPRRDLLVARQELDGAVQAAGALEEGDEARLLIEQARREPRADGERLRLEVVVAQHQRRDVVGHPREDRVALLLGELAVGDGEAEQDLDVDLVVGGVDAGGVVDGVGVDPAAGERVFDAAELRETEIAALDDDLAAQLRAVDAQRVVGAVADVGVGLGRALHVRADAAVIEQIHRRLQDRVDELRRRRLFGTHAEPRAGLGATAAPIWRCAGRHPRPARSATRRSRPTTSVEVGTAARARRGSPPDRDRDR